MALSYIASTIKDNPKLALTVELRAFRALIHPIDRSLSVDEPLRAWNNSASTSSTLQNSAMLLFFLASNPCLA
jgi:hypothetical protein